MSALSISLPFPGEPTLPVRSRVPALTDGSLPDPPRRDEGETLEESQRRREAREILERSLATLSPRDRFVLQCRAEGEPLDKIAKVLAISRQRVQQVEQDALARARKLLERVGIRRVSDVL